MLLAGFNNTIIYNCNLTINNQIWENQNIWSLCVLLWFKSKLKLDPLNRYYLKHLGPSSVTDKKASMNFGPLYIRYKNTKSRKFLQKNYVPETGEHHIPFLFEKIRFIIFLSLEKINVLSFVWRQFVILFVI